MQKLFVLYFQEIKFGFLIHLSIKFIFCFEFKNCYIYFKNQIMIH